MRNQDLFEVNELNKDSNGGTELTVRRLFDLLEREELEQVQIIPSRVRELDPDKFRIYHLHDLPADPEASHLKDPKSRARFDRLVFVSNWQYQQYQSVLGIPYDQQSRVIENGVDPIPYVEKTDPRTNPIRLIYTPTPHRGLEILVPVFERLAETFDFIELDVFSSFKLYGWESRDKQYEELFDRCRQHPRIRYHGTQPQEVVREAYQQAHIFAYPSIWPETSCRCLIEAMMAGCFCVHPNLAALPDTSAGLTSMYDGDQHRDVHANIFMERLGDLIVALRNTTMWEQDSVHTHLRQTSHYAVGRFGWPSVIQRWKWLIQELTNPE